MNMVENEEYCTCESIEAIYTNNGYFGYWDMCSKCNKPLEDSFHYYDEPELY
jgi:hypothetical protein